MRNLLFLTLGLAAGFALGNRRARKAGPVSELAIEVNCDAKPALDVLKELEQQAAKTAMRLEACERHAQVFVRCPKTVLEAVHN